MKTKKTFFQLEKEEQERERERERERETRAENLKRVCRAPL